MHSLVMSVGGYVAIHVEQEYDGGKFCHWNTAVAGIGLGFVHGFILH